MRTPRVRVVYGQKPKNISSHVSGIQSATSRLEYRMHGTKNALLVLKDMTRSPPRPSRIISQ